jgi:hypothetical protein
VIEITDEDGSVLSQIRVGALQCAASFPYLKGQMPRYKNASHRDRAEAIARSAAGMIRIYGGDALTEANRVAVRFGKSNDAEAKKTWRAIGRAIEKQLLPTERRWTNDLTARGRNPTRGADDADDQSQLL